jgi:uncharacterized membrane protein YcjF (UPF0283 family)
MEEKAPKQSLRKKRFLILLVLAVIFVPLLVVECCRALFGGGMWLSWVALGIAVVIVLASRVFEPER